MNSNSPHKNKQTLSWTIANTVTVIRILFVPLFVFVLLSPWPSWFPQYGFFEYAKPWISVVVFILLAVTDSIDGYLARSRNEVTDIGKFMDPLADKILVFAALLSMIELGFIPTWVVLIILMREFIVSGLRMIAATNNTVIAASWYGKAKTVTQIVAIVLFLLKGICIPEFNNHAHPFYIFAWLAMIAALILTIVSMFDYLIKCLPLFGFSFNTAKTTKQASTTCTNNEDEHNYENKDEYSASLCRDVALFSQNHSFIELSNNVSKTINTIHAREIDTCITFWAQKLVSHCATNNITISTAESLTGGMIGEAITSISGSSSVLCGGIIAYTPDTKQQLLGVDSALILKNGCVDENVALQMAQGSLLHTGAHLAVAVTGIAGPGGEEQGKPVGTVWLACGRKDNIDTFCCNFTGDRVDIRKKTTLQALVSLYCKSL